MRLVGRWLWAALDRAATSGNIISSSDALNDENTSRNIKYHDQFSWVATSNTVVRLNIAQDHRRHPAQPIPAVVKTLLPNPLLCKGRQPKNRPNLSRSERPLLDAPAQIRTRGFPA
jgi:hypothetical protein